MMASKNMEAQAQTWILEWQSQIQNEITTLVKARNDINGHIIEYLEAGGENWPEHYSKLHSCIDNQAALLSDLTALYGQRFIHLASHYDKAVKTSTLVNENYDKLEECVEVIRTELRDVVKKLCSFTTLEMDYYDKLLNVWNEHSGSDHVSHITFYRDYENYRERLNQIHRRDQVRLFGNNVCSMIDTVIHIVTKLDSILGNRDNMNEIRKLWQEENRFQY